MCYAIPAQKPWQPAGNVHNLGRVSVRLLIARRFVSLQARQIFDSRGNPTVEVDLVTELGLFRAAVPSGASTGTLKSASQMRWLAAVTLSCGFMVF